MKTKAKRFFDKVVAVMLSVVMFAGIAGVGIGTSVVNAVDATTSKLSNQETNKLTYHSYMVFDNGLTWSDARKYCESVGGHLATITSSSEQQLIEDLLKNKNKNCYWLGGYKTENNSWEWITDEKFEYTNWATDEPNNFYGKESCMLIYNSINPSAAPHDIWEWNDLKDDGTCGSEEFFGLSNMGFICEWDMQNISSIIKFGADRFTFGEDINGSVGSTVDALVVYKSMESNIASLEITSSDPDVVEIGTIEMGVGDYLTSENEHKATVPLKLKAEGKATITIISPEGYSVSIDVTVGSFNMPMYIADMWLDEDGNFKKDIENKMDFSNDECFRVVNTLNSDKKFQNGIHAWELENLIDDPSKITDKMIEKKQYYEAILLSLLSAQFESGTVGSFLDHVKETNIEEKYDLMKKFTKLISGIDGLKLGSDTNKKLTKDQKSTIKSFLQKVDISKISKAFDSIDVVVSIFDYADDLYSFYETCSKYLTIQEIDKSIIAVLNAMYEQTDNSVLKLALSDIIVVCSDKFGQLLVDIENGVTQVVSWTEDMLVDVMWDCICASNPYVVCLKAGLSLGISLSNFLFSTDKEIGKYYELQCLCEVRELINKTSLKLEQNYKNKRSDDNAKAYIASVDFIYDSLVLSYNYNFDFYKTCNDALVVKLLDRKSKDNIKDYEQMTNNIIESITSNYMNLKRNWCYCLIDDYPELFEEMSKKIDLYWWQNIEHAIVYTTDISFDYTGKPIIPTVLVSMNGYRIKEGVDYKLSYSDNTEPGLGKITITGIGDYEGTKVVKFPINKSFFNKRIDIRKNRRSYDNPFKTYTVRSVMPISSSQDIGDLNVTVSKNGKTVLSVENGVVKSSEVQVISDDDMISILLNDEDYDVSVTSNNGVNIDYSYTEYDENYTVTKESVYNNKVLTPNTSLTQNINSSNDEVFLDGTKQNPSITDKGETTKHKVVISQGVASAETATYGEWVYISPVVPDGYAFSHWESNISDVNFNMNKSNNVFLMPNNDVEFTAVLIKTSNYGDTNNDGEVNIADALMISRYDAGLTELNESQLAVSDVNNDGEVNIADALMISRFDAGLITSL